VTGSAGEEDMSVERTQTGHEIRYELRHGAAPVCLLIFGEPEIEPVAWKILLPGPAALTGAVDAQPPLTSGWERRHN
jgi:hypothetical protein